MSLSVLVIAGCEEKDDDKINQAQACLDKATAPSDVSGCLSIIEGITSEKASRIRCGLTVLQYGTTQSEIVDAFTAIQNGSGEDPVIEVATKLGIGDFDTSGTVDSAEEDMAEEIKDICYESNSTGLKTMAQLILFGTRAQIAADAAGDPEDPQDVANNISNMTDADAGEFANDVFELYCEPSYSNTDVCTSLASAGAGAGNDVTVGAALKACIAANNCN